MAFPSEGALLGMVGEGAPQDVFPDKIQEIIQNLSRYENFNIEYVASIIISVMAAAIGNSYQINIRNEWKDSPSLYMMLIGRPGLGKTPPLNFLYKPISDLDDRLDEKYSEELEKFELLASFSKTAITKKYSGSSDLILYK